MKLIQNYKYPNDGIKYTRNLFLQSMCGIYFTAFLSFYYQSPGLIGNNGILPARILIDNNNFISAVHNKPTLLHFSSYLGIDTEHMIDVLGLIGIIISFTGLMSQRICLLPTFAALWSLYYSLIQVSQIFRNQSDYLLLEAGFICIILAPLNTLKKSSPSDKICFIMIKWLLFRFLFASGEVKLASHCPYWWSFTAMSKHFETMPIPTPFSWYSHHLPVSWLKTTNIFINITELICPWFFFLPNRTIQKIIFYWQMFLQFNIILTGNYGFLNFLISILLLSLLDDHYFLDKYKNRTVFIFTIIKYMLMLSGIFMILCFLISPALNSLQFTQYYMYWLKKSITPAPMVVFIIIIGTLFKNLFTHPTIVTSRRFIEKMYAVNCLIGFTLLSITLITISMVPHGNLDKSTNITNTDIGNFYQQIKRFYIVNEYGQHLQKMRSNRMELIFEYSENIDGPWNEYSFLYKPYAANRSLLFAGQLWTLLHYIFIYIFLIYYIFAYLYIHFLMTYKLILIFKGPHLPRLDFKLYDVVQSNYRNHLWTISIAYRLLHNEEKVLKLFGINNKIYPPPKFVRASTHRFKYTTYAEKNKNLYWTKSDQREYFPVYSIDNPSLIAYMKSMKIIQNYKSFDVTNKFLQKILNSIRNQVEKIEGGILIICTLLPALTLLMSQSKRRYL